MKGMLIIMIEFRNVNKRYSTGTEAVNNANFTIEKGEFAFLVGSSGSRNHKQLLNLVLSFPLTKQDSSVWSHGFTADSCTALRQGYVNADT